MTSTANRQRKVTMPINIRKKFAAAICMLLIAAIMMISSTYAWFTLSTAPEVTGITTNVGANGNLEIALLTGESFNQNTDDLGIQTGVGDSMEVKEKTVSNITWGNLVDLADPTYGLDNIILNPAALNIIPFDNTKADYLIGCNIQGGLASPLLAPTYGADGRVINVQQTTTAGVYKTNSSKFEEAINDQGQVTDAGVRAIGVSSGITARVAAYRQAVSAISVAMSAAKSAAQASLVNNGQKLASLLVSAVADPSYELTADDVAAITDVKTSLTNANDSIANAIRQAALAYYLSSANTDDISDDDVAAAVTAFAASDLDDLATLADGVDVSFLNTVISDHDDIQDMIDSVSVTQGQTYTAMEAQIAKLLNKDYVQINGLNGSDLHAEDVGDLASAILASGKVQITMLDGSGIYADIAELVGNYTASGFTITVEYQGIAVNNMPTVMTTSVAGTPVLTTASETAAAGDPVSAGGSTAVDDTYGYMIDLAVRTNAAGSQLLLQQAEKQRIYTNSEAALTQGAGTYVEFTTENRYEFSKEDVIYLMSAVRVLFVTPNDAADGYDILAIAAPNLKAGINDQSGLPEAAIADSRFDKGVSFANSDSDASTTVKALLYLYDLENVAVEQIVEGKEYKTTLGTIKSKTENAVPVADFSIVNLEQNKAKKVCALVYLDGDVVDNTMVRNAATTMSGKVNFQFASSAELIPMDNKAIFDNGTEEGGETTEAQVNFTLAQLQHAKTTVEATGEYQTAFNTAEGERTAEQRALLEVVAYIGDLDDEASQDTLNTAAANLIAACIDAHINNPLA